MPRIANGLVTPERTRTFADDPAVPADHNTVGMGMHISRASHRIGAHQVLVVAKAHQAGLERRGRHRMEAVKPDGTGHKPRGSIPSRADDQANGAGIGVIAEHGVQDSGFEERAGGESPCGSSRDNSSGAGSKRDRQLRAAALRRPEAERRRQAEQHGRRPVIPNSSCAGRDANRDAIPAPDDTAGRAPRCAPVQPGRETQPADLAHKEISTSAAESSRQVNLNGISFMMTVWFALVAVTRGRARTSAAIGKARHGVGASAHHPHLSARNQPRQRYGW